MKIMCNESSSQSAHGGAQEKGIFMHQSPVLGVVKVGGHWRTLSDFAGGYMN